MKKAKSAAKKTAKAPKNPEHIGLAMDFEKSLSELSAQMRTKAYKMHIGTIRQLMNLHNALCDSKATLSASNQNAASLAMRVLETIADQKIERMNAFLSKELDRARSSKKKGKVSRKKTSKKSGAKKASAKKSR